MIPPITAIRTKDISERYSKNMKITPIMGFKSGSSDIEPDFFSNLGYKAARHSVP
jgi:hypothetical protein